MKKKIIITAAIPVVLAVTLLTCSKKSDSAATTSVIPTDESAIAVSVTTVKSGQYASPVVTSGLISTETESRLSFKVPGIIASVLVKEGETLVKGQLLASLDLTEINAQVSQAKNALEKSRRDLERAQRLQKDSASTLEQVQNYQTTFDAASENFRIASFNQRYATIHAPASGKVIRKYFNEGELVGAGAPVFVVNTAAQNNWIVRAGVPDIDWVQLKNGDKAEITLDAYPGQRFEGQISAINEGTDQGNGLYQVEISIKAGGKKLASGLFAKASITPSGKSTSKSIPIEALVEGNGKHAFVFVAGSDGKSVKKIPVVVSHFTATEAVIASGLEETTEVISGGAAFLTEHSIITITR